MPASLVLCAILVVGGMAWITRGTIHSERERAEAELRAAVQERTRLALWRMDSLGASILLEESGFPEGQSRLPVKTRFSVSSKGDLNAVDSDHQLPELSKSLEGQVLDVMCQITQTEPTDPESEQVSQWNASDVQGRTVYNGYAPNDYRSQKAADLNEQVVRSKLLKSTLDNPINYRNRGSAYPVGRAQQRQILEQQSRRKEEEQASHQQKVDLAISEQNFTPPQAADIPLQDQDTIQQSEHDPVQEEQVQAFVLESVVGQPRTGWVNDMLILARKVGVSGEEVFDGAWIDSMELRELLLAEVSDLLLGASLVPA